MTVKQLRKRIEKIIKDIPDSQLPGVLAYLEEYSKANSENKETVKHLQRILSEDRVLLDKLAK